MKHQTYKMLFERNPDGSVTFDQKDMEIITEEHESEQKEFASLLGDDFNLLMNEIESRIHGIATFADNDKASATHIYFGYEDALSSPSQCGIATVSIDLWGEKLNEVKICKDGERIGSWELSKESGSHRLIFIKEVPKEIARKAFSFSHEL